MKVNFEEKYYNLLEKYDRARDDFAKNPGVVECERLQQTKQAFMIFGSFLFEKILEKNSDIFESLK